MSRPKGKMHQVGVMATKDASGNVSFQPESELWSDGEAKFHYHKDRHGMSKHDYHLVEFVIDDRTGDGLTFPKIPHDAMWVAKVDDPSVHICPDKDTKS